MVASEVAAAGGMSNSMEKPCRMTSPLFVTSHSSAVRPWKHVLTTWGTSKLWNSEKEYPSLPWLPTSQYNLVFRNLLAFFRWNKLLHIYWMNREIFYPSDASMFKKTCVDHSFCALVEGGDPWSSLLSSPPDYCFVCTLILNLSREKSEVSCWSSYCRPLMCVYLLSRDHSFYNQLCQKHRFFFLLEEWIPFRWEENTCEVYRWGVLILFPLTSASHKTGQARSVSTATCL